MLERGVRIPALMSWVSVLCWGSDTSALRSVSLCECAVSSSLDRTLFCPHVFCGVARSWCFYRLRPFMLCLVLCGTQLVLFISCMVSCCHVWTCGLWVFSLTACSCPVLHMASDFVLLAMCLCFCFVWAHCFVLVFCVPCALMSIVLTPPILLPDYWLICPTCLPSLLSSFALLIISLCLQSFASSSLYHPWLRWICPVLALPCPALPCPAFPLRGSFR